MKQPQQPQLFVIDAEHLPSQSYSISIREPLFRDRREASRRMPNDDTNLGFSIEQLLLAICLEEVDGKQFNKGLRDPIAKIEMFQPADAQYLVSLFLEMFTLNEEVAESVKSLGEQLKSDKAFMQNGVFTIAPEYLPTNSHSVTFRRPTTGEQIEVDRRYPGAESGCGYSAEELLFCNCITHINGEELEKPKELISILDPWTHIDAQFALAVFLNICFIDRQTRASAKSLGKQLRQSVNKKPPSTESASKRATATSN